jgi:membrane protein implicated in regulation of membrane protease activity
MVVAWFALGIVLLLFELHHLAFYALFAAAGSLAAAGLAVVAPDAWGAQGGVAIGISVAGVVLVRPLVSRAYERRHPHLQVARGVHGGLVGLDAVTLDDVGDHHHVGHVRLVGERWLAVTDTGEMVAPGVPVRVRAVKGTTLVVSPLAERTDV